MFNHTEDRTIHYELAMLTEHPGDGTENVSIAGYEGWIDILASEYPQPDTDDVKVLQGYLATIQDLATQSEFIARVEKDIRVGFSQLAESAKNTMRDLEVQ